eukprot:Hpha_TRINITY_DN2665_c0_g1::TRINITY_DN2665_c0_g1_i1::g.145835::m.145835
MHPGDALPWLLYALGALWLAAGGRAAVIRWWALREQRASSPRPIVLFDGVCVMCCGFVDFCRARDAAINNQPLAYGSLDSPAGKLIQERHSIPQPAETFVLVEGGAVYTRSDAALLTLSRLSPSALWILIMLFHPIPRVLRDGVYNFGWRVRRRVFGTRECYMVPHDCAVDPAMLQ